MPTLLTVGEPILPVGLTLTLESEFGDVAAAGLSLMFAAKRLRHALHEEAGAGLESLMRMEKPLRMQQPVTIEVPDVDAFRRSEETSRPRPRPRANDSEMTLGECGTMV